MHGQEYVATTWAMANMNMVIHDMEGTIESGGEHLEAVPA